MPSTPPQKQDQISQQGTGQQPVNHRMRNAPDHPEESFPPYPLTGDAFARFLTARRDAARTRDLLIENHNMEVDAFGFARFREDLRQEEPQLQADRQDRVIQRIPIQPASSSPEGASSSTAEEEDVQHGSGNMESTAIQQYHSDCENIISEDNPEFRDVALRLKALRESSGLAPAPTLRTTKAFRPSFMALEQMGYVEPREGSKYQGHKSKEDRTFIPDSLNCGLWLSCLDPATTVTEIFDAVRTGAVASLNLTPAQKGYATAAAGLYFMKHSGAEHFLAQVNSPRGIWIHGVKIKAIYNKHGALQQSDLSRSRVLRIQGPAQEMKSELWQKFWSKWVIFQLSHVERNQMNGGQAEMYFSFSRIDGQACSAKMFFERQAAFVGLFQCEYAKDPCNRW